MDPDPLAALSQAAVLHSLRLVHLWDGDFKTLASIPGRSTIKSLLLGQTITENQAVPIPLFLLHPADAPAHVVPPPLPDKPASPFGHLPHVLFRAEMLVQLGSGETAREVQQVQAGTMTESTVLVLCVVRQPASAAPHSLDAAPFSEDFDSLSQALSLSLLHPERCYAASVPPPLTTLLAGPSGIGKTTFLRHYAEQNKVSLLTVTANDIFISYPGAVERGVKQWVLAALNFQPAILVFDHADVMFPSRRAASAAASGLDDDMNDSGEADADDTDSGSASGDQSEDDARLLHSLLACIQDLRVGRASAAAHLFLSLVLTTSRGALSVDAFLRSKCDVTVLARALSFSFRETLVHHLAAKLESRVSAVLCPGRENASPILSPPLVESILDNCQGFSAGDFSLLFGSIHQLAAAELSPSSDARQLSYAQVRPFVERIRARLSSAIASSSQGGQRSHRTLWTDIGGLGQVKTRLKEAVAGVHQHREHYQRLGTRPPRGILLYGPPGTGKTLLAKALATETHSNFVSVSVPDLVRGAVGESERRLRGVFARAMRLVPCVLFFDEIDALFGTVADGGQDDASGGDSDSDSRDEWHERRRHAARDDQQPGFDFSSSASALTAKQAPALGAKKGFTFGAAPSASESKPALARSGTAPDKLTPAEEKLLSAQAGHSTSAKLLAQMLTCFNNTESAEGLVVLAATNCPQVLDRSLLRSGRLEVHLFVPPPPADERAQILHVLRDAAITERGDENSGSAAAWAADVDVDWLVDKTERFTGADLRSLVREAGVFAVQRLLRSGEGARVAPQICMGDFVQALNYRVFASVSEEQLQSLVRWV